MQNKKGSPFFTGLISNRILTVSRWAVTGRQLFTLAISNACKFMSDTLVRLAIKVCIDCLERV